MHQDLFDHGPYFHDLYDVRANELCVIGIYCRSVHQIYVSLDLNPGIELV